MYSPNFQFSISNESAKFNFNLLKKHDFDLEKNLNPEKICVTNYGSELKSVEELDNLWMKHPRWKTLRDKLTKCCAYPVNDLIEKIRMADLKENLERGKHKSPKRNEHFLGKSMKKEVENGWGILLPEDDAASTPGLEIIPMGLAEHLGINAFEENIPKKRVTHDLSFLGIKSKKSLNPRVSCSHNRTS